MTEQKDIIVLKVLKAKSGKSMIQYGIKDAPNNFSKGVTVLSQWFEDSRAYDNISNDLLLKPLKGTTHYEPSFDGKATLKLDELFDENGVSVFSK